MSAIRTSITSSLRQFHTPTTAFRSLSTTARLHTDPPPGNHPPSAQKAGRESHVSTDKQSSASTQEHKTGDDHPAKQPDPQPESDRSTGFKESSGGVKGGKEGLGQRTDK